MVQVPRLRQLNIGQSIDRFNQGQEQKFVANRRNALLEAGGRLAAGDFEGGQDRLFEEGLIGEGISIANFTSAQKQRVVDTISSRAVAADTPEKWSVFVRQVATEFGPEAVAGFEDFSTREDVISRALSAKEQLALQQREEEAAEDRRRFEVTTDLKRRELDLKEKGKRPTGKPLKLIGPDGQSVTFRQDDPRVDEALAQGFNVVSTNAAKAPSGFRFKNDGSGDLEPIPGGPASKLPGDVAGKLALIRAAAEGLPDAIKFFESDERDSVTTRAKESALLVAGAGDIGRATRTIRFAIEGALRAATGAAAPETEVTRFMEMFGPSPLDSKRTRKAKLKRLRSFLNNMEEAVTQGRVVNTDELIPDQTGTGKIGKMSLEELQSLDISQLSNAELEAAQARFEELGAE